MASHSQRDLSIGKGGRLALGRAVLSVVFSGAVKAMVLFSRLRARLHGEESIPVPGERSLKALAPGVKTV